LERVAVRRWPVRGLPQRPEIDDVAEQVERRGVEASEKGQQSLGLRAARAEVEVAEEDRAVPDPATYGLGAMIGPEVW
jgi:hypothetical protein